jgi:phosphoserine phosphatase RsbU/P
MLQDVKKSKVLIVDDTPENIQVLMETLKDRYTIVAAINGEKALKLAVAKPQPELILLDIMMPGMDGFEVCRRLKADPQTREIPVIFLSALDDTANKVKGFAEGAVDYISKPFQPEEVHIRVNTHLNMSLLNREVQHQREQLEKELKVVSELQFGLLPGGLPEIRAVNLAVHYETCRYAGGDYYDVVELPDGCYGFLVADAEGHSAPAAVMMAMTCALFRSCRKLHAQPDMVIDFINRELGNVNSRESFVTAVYAVYDTASRKIRIARAGHPLPILFRPAEGKSRNLTCEGVFMMGLIPYENVPVTEISLFPGDRLLFYTDGITERFNANNGIYGEERLCRIMEQPDVDSPRELLDSILHDLADFAGDRQADDDQAMLLLMPE